MEELSKIKQGIKKELLRMEEDCIYSSKSHFNCADSLRKLYYIIGIPLVVLTAISTKHCIEIITLSAFVLSTIQTFLNPYKMAENHKIAGNSYLEIKNTIRGFYSYEIYKFTDEEAVAKINCIKEGINKINKSSPIPLNSGFKKAIEGIKNGEAEYIVDREEK